MILTRVSIRRKKLNALFFDGAEKNIVRAADNRSSKYGGKTRSKALKIEFVSDDESSPENGSESSVYDAYGEPDSQTRNARYNRYKSKPKFEGEKQFDGDYASDGGLLIDRGVFERSGYSEGGYISEDDVEYLIAASRVERAKSKALWLLDARDYTRKGMFDKLVRDFGEDAANAVADRMVELELIDDERYAERYAEQLMAVRDVPKREAVYKLMQKGVPRDIAQNAVEEIEVTPESQLDEIIRKKYAYRLSTGGEKELQRVINALARKGFGFSDIRAAVSRYCDADIYE